jgi:WD40 repeat protein
MKIETIDYISEILLFLGMSFEEITGVVHSASTQKRIWCCNWKFNGKTLLSTGEDKVVKIWGFNKGL